MKFSTFEKLVLNKNLTFPELIEWFQSYVNENGKNIRIDAFLAQTIPSIFPNAVSETIQYFMGKNEVSILEDKNGRIVKVWLTKENILND
jgi:hypothetical protein